MSENRIYNIRKSKDKQEVMKNVNHSHLWGTELIDGGAKFSGLPGTV